jgi:hypothetical protein
MAGRPTLASEHDLTLECQEAEDGYWSFALLDSSGNLLYERDGYKDEKNARQAANRWLKLNIEEETRLTKVPPRRHHTTAHSELIRTMRRKAGTNEAEAIRLREQAELLESEAKRLAAAADILEGPEE